MESLRIFLPIVSLACPTLTYSGDSSVTMASPRRPGLQARWDYVFDSLESIIPIYETGSSRIALFSDSRMRDEVVKFAVGGPGLVLDLGSGPGTMARVVGRSGGTPVLVDASRRMLLAAGSELMVQAAFEALPFRDGAFSSVVAGFSLRDSQDLFIAVGEVRRVTADGGRFALCDLGKPDSFLKAVVLGAYIRVGVPVIGVITGGRAGLGFVSLYDTYLLTMKNGFLSALLGTRFSSVDLRARQLGGSITVCCRA
jgi:ubiquinone/menaquinone biosynthesis C-methylase UbiE